MNKRLILPAAVLAVALSLTLLSALTFLAGTNAPLMLRMMKTHAPEELTGLDERFYEPVVDMITGYLANEREEFQCYARWEDGVCLTLFNEREQQHMADCRRLFSLCRELMLSGAAVSLLCAAILTAFREERRARALGLAIGFGVVLTAAAALLLWGIIDFDGLFILFHRLSFANDLWLMDPSRDLIIRLMPTDFFLTYAAGIGLLWLVGSAAGLIYALMTLRKEV